MCSLAASVLILQGSISELSNRLNELLAYADTALGERILQFHQSYRLTAPESSPGTGSAFMQRFVVRFVCVLGRLIGLGRTVFQRSVFSVFRGVRLLGVRSGAESVEGLWTIAISAVCGLGSGPGLPTFPQRHPDAANVAVSFVVRYRTGKSQMQWHVQAQHLHSVRQA